MEQKQENYSTQTNDYCEWHKATDLLSGHPVEYRSVNGDIIRCNTMTLTELSELREKYRDENTINRYIVFDSNCFCTNDCRALDFLIGALEMINDKCISYTGSHGCIKNDTGEQTDCVIIELSDESIALFKRLMEDTYRNEINKSSI